jgi:hypothetical protein
MNDTDRGNPKYGEGNLPRCHFFSQGQCFFLQKISSLTGLQFKRTLRPYLLVLRTFHLRGNCIPIVAVLTYNFIKLRLIFKKPKLLYS